MRLVATLALAALLAACSSTAVVPTTAPATTASSAPADTATPEPVVVPETPSPAPSESTGRYVPGDVITITKGDAPWAEIVVSNVAVKTRYGSGYSVSKPERGNVYIQARITYTALDNGVDYNPFDWQVFVDGEAVKNYAIVLDGPKPELNSGTLPQGRKASGYVVYEVAAKGEVLLSYGSSAFTNDAPIFEVVLRSK